MARESNQRLVALFMAKTVIDLFEMIDIAENNCQSPTITMRPCDLLDQRQVRLATIGQLGHMIGVASFFELFLVTYVSDNGDAGAAIT